MWKPFSLALAERPTLQLRQALGRNHSWPRQCAAVKSNDVVPESMHTCFLTVERTLDLDGLRFRGGAFQLTVAKIIGTLGNMLTTLATLRTDKMDIVCYIGQTGIAFADRHRLTRLSLGSCRIPFARATTVTFCAAPPALACIPMPRFASSTASGELGSTRRARRRIDSSWTVPRL